MLKSQMGSNLSCVVVCVVTGIRFALVLCLAWSVLQYFPTPLRLGFKASPAASVQAGLLISPHTQTWAATLCMTHVAPKNVHFNSALARRDGNISSDQGENVEEDVCLWLLEKFQGDTTSLASHIDFYW